MQPFWVAYVGIKKLLSISCCCFFNYLFWFLQENIFSFLSDTWSSINFGAPISTKFRSILLPDSIELVRTCWFFTSQSSMKEMKHGNGGKNRAIEHLRAEHRYKDIWVIGLSHWNVQNIGMKYLYFKKKISERSEISFDARFIFQGQEFYMLQRLLSICFTPPSFAVSI